MGGESSSDRGVSGPGEGGSSLGYKKSGSDSGYTGKSEYVNEWEKAIKKKLVEHMKKTPNSYLHKESDDDLRELILDLGKPKRYYKRFLEVKDSDLRRKIAFACEEIEEKKEMEEEMEEENEDVLFTEEEEKENKDLILLWGGGMIRKVEIPVYLVLTESEYDGFFSRNYAWLLGNEYGTLHAALLVGPFLLEWGCKGSYGTSIVKTQVDRKIFHNLVAKIKLEKNKGFFEILCDLLKNFGIKIFNLLPGWIHQIGMTEVGKIEKLAKVCTRYNKLCTYGYTKSSTGRNCQNFVDACVKQLGLEIPKIGEIGEFLERIRNNGNSKLMLRGKEIDSRKELDKLVDLIGWDKFEEYDKKYILDLIEIMNERKKNTESLLNNFDDPKGYEIKVIDALKKKHNEKTKDVLEDLIKKLKVDGSSEEIWNERKSRYYLDQKDTKKEEEEES